MGGRSRKLAGIAAVLASLVSRPAGAQDALARAKAEFQEGLAMQTAGNWAGALQKFQAVAAVKMTPQVRFNIALCEEHLGKLVAAIGDYQIAEADAGESVRDVAEKAHAAAETLATRVPKLTIQVDASAARADVKLDDVALGATALGKETRVDPGTHTVVATLGGRKLVDKTLQLGEGQSETVVVKDEAGTAATPASGETSTGVSKRTIAYVVGGAGVASIVVGTVLFLGPRKDAIDELDRVCRNGHCPVSSQDTIDSGRMYTGLAEAAWLVGAAGVAVGAVLYVRSNEEAAPTVSFGVSPRGFVARGAW